MSGVKASEQQPREPGAKGKDRELRHASNTELRGVRHSEEDAADTRQQSVDVLDVRSAGPDVDLGSAHQDKPADRAPSHATRRGEVLSTRGVIDETAKREKLKAMLDVAETRHERGKARRADRPQFAAGVRLQVLRGDKAGRCGILLDADYIHTRCLIELDGATGPVWIGFTDLKAAPVE